jgi:hypothetical protein
MEIVNDDISTPVQNLCRMIEEIIIGVPRCSNYRQYREIGFIRHLSKELLKVRSNNNLCPDPLIAGLFTPLVNGTRVCRHKAVVYDIPATTDGSCPAVSAIVTANGAEICVVVGKMKQNHEAFFKKYDLQSYVVLAAEIRNNWTAVECDARFVYLGPRFEDVDVEFEMQCFCR